jgi:hypothetical protein
MSVSHAAVGRGKGVLPQNLIHALEQVWTEALAATTLTALVLVVLKGVRHLGVAVIAHVLEERDRALRTQELRCPKCTGPLRRDKSRRQVTRMTLLGKVTYGRTSFCCRGCGHREFPLDEQLSLKALLRGHSDEFAKDVVLFCTVMPFGKGCELFTRCYGFLVSTHLARALTLAIGTRLYQSEMARAKELWALRERHPETFLPLPATLRQMTRHQRVYVMMDNSKLGFQEGKRGRGAPRLKTLRKLAQQAKRRAVRAAKRHKPGSAPAPVMPAEAAFAEADGWKDVRALLIFREADLAQTSKDRREILHRRVLAHVGSQEEWLQLVHLAFHEEGVYTAHEVIVVADGGNGIWEMVDELLPNTTFRKVIEVLDWCHAASHLWTVGRALKGCKTEAQRQACIAWVLPLLDDIFDGKVANVVQRLRKLVPASPTAADEVRKCIDYFTDHQGRMRYSWFRKHGYLIGSGAVESVHNWVIQARCRLPGMRWSESGVNAMLRLRCAWASARFDEEFARAARGEAPDDQASHRELLRVA